MVSARILGVVGAGLVTMMGGAQASSIIRLEASTSTPSIIRLEALEPGKLSSAVTPSVVALGDAAQAVSNEKVAAIPAKPRHGTPAPMIIRGGVIGGAFATPAPATSAKTDAPATEPADGSTPATPSNGTAAAAPNSDSRATAADKTASDGAQQQPQATPQKPPKLPANGKAM
ncbi:hypothetical protein EN817_30040 [Mesorhizobium sp. M3A.F.Ca.ET.174.01.1.1]|uniref:hypothetical protein n=1 Tax=unclassified Mesorhizobium TaxID=325217 RepID=UPI001093EBA5|nr:MULTISPECIES: hypothetical protein [unclassified Mesorhizobium]TGS71606.1 hypothetical protein EN844_01005 [Mesorhizobium sp. M3A.F.Ca.ET.201.01.1.1]TGS81968.1 hypothetical protein EN818_29810 [Mesorhizobium sp. M3A.F.Ca.ET.175.01.1.1]TGT21809.1 hypothetical protein EN817_30040 [Mesorhizobium sp. M3A.F.Ca.ET.174.01.1.1]